MLKPVKMIIDCRNTIFTVFTLRLQCKGATAKIPVIVKNRFLQESLKIFGCLACKLFKVLYKVGLVKEIVFVADFS